MRCEGWRRKGGMFSFGPAVWVHCENEATVILTVKQEKVEEMPACMECWHEAMERGMNILKARPVDQER